MKEQDHHLTVRRGHDAASIAKDFEDHLIFTLARDKYSAGTKHKYLALAHTIRDRLIDRWIITQQTHHRERAKRVYYLSLEFLMGRVMGNNIINLGIKNQVMEACKTLGVNYGELEEMEHDMGLGNGGLGRLAACFIDSMATLEIPCMGYGIYYQYGIFRQAFRDGYQIEHPDDWLEFGNPWGIRRAMRYYPVHFGGRLESKLEGGEIKHAWVDAQEILGQPFDIPIVGYGGKTVNTLRLWRAHAAEEFDFQDFNKGDYVRAVEDKVSAENLSKVLYPNDHHYEGKELRLRQQYLFVSCSIQDILRRFKSDMSSTRGWDELPERVAIQLNDTHPSLAVPELMRLLIDREGLSWNKAWDLTQKTLAYTNHTLMPEALEKWPQDMLQKLLPRHLQIIFDINQKFIDKLLVRYPGDMQRVARMSIIEEGMPKMVRMANLSIIGSHSTNGVAEIHTDLLKKRVVPDFAEFYPERFNAKTNGITQRRWLLHANPGLADLINETIGDDWITQMTHLRKLEPYAENADFRARFRQVKLEAKKRLTTYMEEHWGWQADPNAIFDVHIKRLHEYKRQLMNAIHIVMRYNELRKNPDLDVPKRVFLFGAKAAPGYHMAKLIIKLLNDISWVINNDETIKGKIKVFFLPNYRVTLAEKMIPATDVSEQISTAGTEASGTGNMKFMANGALTVGTLDGANIEMAEEVGEENMFIFGLNAKEAAELAHNPVACYRADAAVREALDLIFANHFNPREPGLYEPIRRALLMEGDGYLLLADLPAYAKAHRKIDELWRDQEAWTRKAILNVAASGKFSSDRTILQYAGEIWKVLPCPVPPQMQVQEDMGRFDD